MVAPCPHPPTATATPTLRATPRPAVSCPAGLEPIPVVDDEIDFTPMWEFNHLCENSMKYKLFPADPSAVPKCGGGAAWLTTTMQDACYSVRGAGAEGRGSVVCVLCKELSRPCRVAGHRRFRAHGAGSGQPLNLSLQPSTGEYSGYCNILFT